MKEVSILFFRVHRNKQVLLKSHLNLKYWNKNINLATLRGEKFVFLPKRKVYFYLILIIVLRIMTKLLKQFSLNMSFITYKFSYVYKIGSFFTQYSKGRDGLISELLEAGKIVQWLLQAR